MEEAVFELCAMGDALKFQRLVQEDESVLTQTIGLARHTPLHLACKFKHNELSLLILGLEPALAKAKNEKEETPLHEASRVGVLEIVKPLLDACPCAAYMLNRDKQSALFLACSCGHSEVAWELCSRMDFLAWDEIGAACLQIAASKGYTEIVRMMLEENPSLASRKSEKGLSALHLASSKGNLGVINEFLGKDPNLSFLSNNDGRTPLHLGMIYNQVHAVKEFLFERSKPVSFNSLLVTDLVNTADSNGDTVLHLAAKMNCLEIIELLLSKPGIKVNAANNEGNTALDILEQIPVRGNDANVAVDILKQIPAHDKEEFVAVDLLKQIQERDNDEYVAIDVSEQIPARDTDGNVANDSYWRRKAIIQQLKPRDRANPSSLDHQIIELLPRKPGIKVNATNNEGNTALDILEQIPVRGNDANVAVDILKQIPAHDKEEYVADDAVNDYRRIIQQKTANPPAPTNMQMKLITVAGLILTVTFQALLSPPGGSWQDSGRGNHDINRKPGKAIQKETNPGLYKFFMGFTALGFLVSSALILITMILHIEKKLYVNSLVVLALVSIIVAFILNLIMIS